jgi:DNA-binding transcriptional regulator YhcF (GntR family)
MEYVQHINHLYGSTLVTLVKGMKLNIANQKISEFMTTLLELGYSKQELIEYINTYLKEES